MSLKKYSHEEKTKMSMIELANMILADQKKELNFLDLFTKVSELKGFSEAEKDEYLARFYTDLNVDGRFTALGSNMWGLKRWYPVSQTAEKALAESRKRNAINEDEEVEDIDLENEIFDEDEEVEIDEDFDDYDLDYDDEEL